MKDNINIDNNERIIVHLKYSKCSKNVIFLSFNFLKVDDFLIFQLLFLVLSFF